MNTISEYSPTHQNTNPQDVFPVMSLLTKAWEGIPKDRMVLAVWNVRRRHLGIFESENGLLSKEKTSIASDNKFAKAGEKSEAQMAHYLDRKFKEIKNVFVFHDLRLERQGDVAQMDHLVFHPYGFAIIESKSVSGSVKINVEGEWARVYGRKSQGMPSPIQQAKRQRDILEKLLQDNADELLTKKLGIFKIDFSKYMFDVFVAISDQGEIKRPKKNSYPEAMKADQITDAVNAKLAEYKDRNKFFTKSEPAFRFAEEDMAKVVLLLQQSHKPAKDENQSTKKPVEVKPGTENAGICKYCQSTNVKKKPGRYGPYYACLDCQKNTSLKQATQR